MELSLSTLVTRCNIVIQPFFGSSKYDCNSLFTPVPPELHRQLHLATSYKRIHWR